MTNVTGLAKADFLPPLITERKIILAQRFANDILPMLQKQFTTYRIVSLSMKQRPLHRVLKLDESGKRGQFTDSAVWFAFDFGCPIGISAWMMEYGLDVLVNAESMEAQDLFQQRIESDPSGFDALLQRYPVRLELWLKYAHQPRFFHWIPAERLESGFNSDTILSIYESHANSLARERTQWIDYIKRHSQLSNGQVRYLQSRNTNLNLQAELVCTLPRDSELWERPYLEQMSHIYSVVKDLMPYIDFFCK